MYLDEVNKFSMRHMSEKHQAIITRILQITLNQLKNIRLDKSPSTIFIDEIELINYNPVITGLHL